MRSTNDNQTTRALASMRRATWLGVIALAFLLWGVLYVLAHVAGLL